jgi:hypothetical protein
MHAAPFRTQSGTGITIEATWPTTCKRARLVEHVRNGADDGSWLASWF